MQKLWHRLLNPENWEEAQTLSYLLEIIYGLRPFKVMSTSDKKRYWLKLDKIGFIFSLFHVTLFTVSGLIVLIDNNEMMPVFKISLAFYQSLCLAYLHSVYFYILFINIFLRRNEHIVVAQKLHLMEESLTEIGWDTRDLHKHVFQITIRLILVFTLFTTGIIIYTTQYWFNGDKFLDVPHCVTIVLPQFFIVIMLLQFLFATYGTKCRSDILNKVLMGVLHHEKYKGKMKYYNKRQYLI